MCGVAWVLRFRSGAGTEACTGTSELKKIHAYIYAHDADNFLACTPAAFSFRCFGRRLQGDFQYC